ncbi:hypothetical protein MTR_1g102365 [Medicago truncatula]|uniref:Uncharacterized protein n=1 Tax=Medicago truncatula TaxID=3880 RepID=A0A072VQ15_MEDTR|nr:hypothetical protein MTR_1g102365 [Medicago truncatula]
MDPRYLNRVTQGGNHTLLKLVSNLLFNFSLDSPNRATSYAKGIHLGANSWTCFRSMYGTDWVGKDIVDLLLLTVQAHVTYNQE